MKDSEITGDDSSLRVKCLTNDQFQTLLRYVKNRADEARRKGTTRAIVDELIVLLLVNTGLHASELCNLRIPDLPTEHSENAIWVRDSKGDVVRTVEIDSKMSECLNRFVRLYRKDAKPDQPLIINERGKRISYMSVYSKLRRIGEKAKIGKLHPHTLRCTYIVRLFSNNKDLRFVQEQAGHSSQKITALYAKMASDLLQDGATSDNVYSHVKATDVSQGRSTPAECASQKTINQKESYYLDESQKIVTCEACNNPILAGSGTKIDSGQIICDVCLKELRSKYPSINS